MATTKENKEKNELMTQKKQMAQELGLVLPKDISDMVLNTLNTSMEAGNFQVPATYHLGNALKSAYTIIANDEKLMHCDNASKANALVQMAVLGLSPAKKQLYFLPMGGKVVLMPSYFGKISAIKRIRGVKDVKSDVIYDSTEYVLDTDDFGNDSIEITKPAPLEVRGDATHIIGAWAKIILDESVWGTQSFCTVMNMNQIRNAWSLGNGKGNTFAHQKFTDEMAKKTVINRAIKMFVNTSDDSDLISGALNDIAENEVKQQEFEVVEKQELLEEQVIEFKDEDKSEEPAEAKSEEKAEVIAESEPAPVEAEIVIEDAPTAKAKPVKVKVQAEEPAKAKVQAEEPAKEEAMEIELDLGELEF